MAGNRTTLPLALVLCTACAAPSRRPAAPAPVAVQASAAPMPPSDASLLTTRRESDSLQAVIGALAAIKATDPDVKRLAQALLRDHLATVGVVSQLAAQLGVPAVMNAASRRGTAPVVMRLQRMLPGAAFDSAFVELVVATHRFEQAERTRLEPTVSEPVRAFLEDTQPMLDWHLRMAEALRASFAR